MLARHGPVERLRERLDAAGVRRGGYGEDGVSFVGERRGATAALVRGLGDLAHLGLGHQDHVQGDLPQYPGDEREGAPDLRHPRPVGVPRHRGLRELQLPRELPEHGDAGFAEGGERP